jgi:DNA-binding FadR family transcriptional regulator
MPAAANAVLAAIIKLNAEAPAYERVPASLRDICLKTGLSRVDARACIKSLIADGLVVAKPGDGVGTFATNYVPTVKARLRGVLIALASDGIVLDSVAS